MGTNFYDQSGTHVGKRSAAGFYCWDCGVTLCKAGKDGVHNGISEWSDRCPKCKQPRAEESLKNSAMGVELGLDKNYQRKRKKKGVMSCSSFSWAVSKIPSCEISDEYGRAYSPKAFGDMLAGCPIQFTKLIGKEFS